MAVGGPKEEEQGQLQQTKVTKKEKLQLCKYNEADGRGEEKGDEERKGKLEVYGLSRNFQGCSPGAGVLPGYRSAFLT